MNGAPGGIRTHDQLIKSQLLYQLSYRGNQQHALHNACMRMSKNRTRIPLAKNIIATFVRNPAS